MVGRTWPIAPDRQTLLARWQAFTSAAEDRKPSLLQEHSRDRRVDTVLSDNLSGYAATKKALRDEEGPPPAPVRYAYRSFDRQWIIPDKRLINQPNPTLWRIRGESQVYLTALERTAPRGSGATFSADIPDLDHYQGSFGGRAWPLWLDAAGTVPNVPAGLLTTLSDRLGRSVTAPALMAYLAAILSNPGYTEHFHRELRTPGLRVPITAEDSLYDRAVDIGARVLWLHSYGTRYVDPAKDRPAGPPRLAAGESPRVLVGHPFSTTELPEELVYCAEQQILQLGAAHIGPVSPAVDAYTVGGKNVLRQWFSYRKADRERPSMGDRRNSPLSAIQPSGWLPEYTEDLLDLLNVLALVVDLHPTQATLLRDVLGAPRVTVADLTVAGVLPIKGPARAQARKGEISNVMPADPDTLFG